MSTKTLFLEPSDIPASAEKLRDAFAKGSFSGVETLASKGAVRVKMPVNRLAAYHFAYDQTRCSWTTSKARIILSLTNFVVEQQTDKNIFSIVLKQRSAQPTASSEKGSKNQVREIFVTRSLRAIEELKLLDESELIKAVEAPTDCSVLLSLLNTEAALSGIRSRDPLAGARLRGLAAKRSMLEAEGGVLSSAEAADLLQISRQAVDKRRTEGKLLGLELGRKGFRYPVWQFGLNGVEKVLAALKKHDPWEQLSFFLNPNGLLADRCPLQVLQQGVRELPDILKAAAGYGEQSG